MKPILISLLSLAAALVAHAAPEPNLEPAAHAAKPAKPAKPVNPALVDVQDVPGQPRVLLIGDSISMGYTLLVRDKLKNRANVHFTPAGYEQLADQVVTSITKVL